MPKKQEMFRPEDKEVQKGTYIEQESGPTIEIIDEEKEVIPSFTELLRKYSEEITELVKPEESFRIEEEAIQNASSILSHRMIEEKESAGRDFLLANREKIGERFLELRKRAESERRWKQFIKGLKKEQIFYYLKEDPEFEKFLTKRERWQKLVLLSESLEQEGPDLNPEARFGIFLELSSREAGEREVKKKFWEAIKGKSFEKELKERLEKEHGTSEEKVFAESGVKLAERRILKQVFNLEWENTLRREYDNVKPSMSFEEYKQRKEEEFDLFVQEKIEEMIDKFKKLGIEADKEALIGLITGGKIIDFQQPLVLPEAISRLKTSSFLGFRKRIKLVTKGMVLELSPKQFQEMIERYKERYLQDKHYIKESFKNEWQKIKEKIEVKILAELERQKTPEIVEELYNRLETRISRALYEKLKAQKNKDKIAEGEVAGREEGKEEKREQEEESKKKEVISAEEIEKAAEKYQDRLRDLDLKGNWDEDRDKMREFAKEIFLDIEKWFGEPPINEERFTALVDAGSIDAALKDFHLTYRMTKPNKWGLLKHVLSLLFDLQYIGAKMIFKEKVDEIIKKNRN